MASCEQTIECCSSNLSFDTWSRLLESDLNVNKQYCLQRCGLCHNEAFLVSDGKVLIGNSHGEMLDEIVGEIDE